ncbi:MAG: ABC transporter ATP-binding protein [Acidimicrobiia bacterium]
MPDPRPGSGGGRLQDVIRRLQEARNRPPKGSDAVWSGPVSDSGSPVLPVEGSGTEVAETGELLWRPFQPKELERTRPFRTAPPSRDEFESHLSQFLGAHPRKSGPLFRIQGLSVGFGPLVAVNDVDLELNDGEIVAVVGPNGAGKTTLCDALGGFTPAGTGRVYFGDRDVSGLPAHQRGALGMARTFSRPALFESMTAVENVMVGRHRRMRGGFFSCGFGLALSKHEDRLARTHAHELLEFLGVDEHAEVPVAVLPGGVRRLVELARALAAEPRLAVLDEPTAGLDPAERRELSERIGMMCDEMGVAVLVTDMDLPFVSSLADYVYVLDAGSVVGRGEPGEVEDARVRAAFLRPVMPPPSPPEPPESPDPPESPEPPEPAEPPDPPELPPWPPAEDA